MEIIDGLMWDFGPNDPIEYFDHEKSYYITKYRPINEIEGLDFNPDWFREDAIEKLRNKRYNNAPFKSKPYMDFWKERFKRCNEGYECNGYRVTGDHYFFLNFYNLKTKAEGLSGANNQIEMSFSKFLVFQYEYFHYVEMCEHLGKDVAVIKARGVGASEMNSSLCVRPYTTLRNQRLVMSAFSDKNLDPTLTKLWYQLDWLNKNTDGAFRRSRMVTNTKYKKRASKKLKNNEEDPTSHGSEIEGIVADKPDKVRGDRCQRLFYEEAGLDPNLITKYIQGEALITILGDTRVGTRFVFGTGGSEGPALEGLKSITTDPKAYNVLPHRHKFTPRGDYAETAFFIPAYRIVFSKLDNRGFTKAEDGIEHFLNIRKSKEGDPAKLLTYCAEYCFTIEEALIKQGDNMFPREELAEQLTNLDIYKGLPKPSRGFLVWERDKNNNRTGKVNWREDTKGTVYIMEHPIVSKDSNSYRNLYVGGIDSIDIGQKDTATQDINKLSRFCITIKKRAFGISEPMYVAMYIDRPRDIREAYENAAKLLTYFGAKGVYEATRTALLTYFRDNSYINLLMKRPRSTLADATKSNSNMYGAPATPKVISHYRELIYEFCLHYSQTIYFKEMLEQLLNYSDEKKKEFDIVAAMGHAELGDEELSNRPPKETESTGAKFQDYGYWIDRRGIKHFGKIPSESERELHEYTKTTNTGLYSEFV